MTSRPPADQPFNLDPEQARRLASAPSVKVEGILDTPENRAFFGSRGIDLDKINISGRQGDSHRDQPPVGSRHPQYSSLAPTGQIRLLQIEPGSGEEPLRCQLQHHSLQKPHSYDASLSSYDALSYTWNAPIRTRYYTQGPPDPTNEFTSESWLASVMGGCSYTISDGMPPASFEPQAHQVDERELMRSVEILIDGQSCDVTGNLGAALRQLRLPDHARNLWVDALCIDQQNLQERSEQVSQMDRIYQSADTVHIWLGPAADGSDRAIVVAQAIWQYKHIAEADPMELFECEKTKDRVAVLAGLEELTVLCMRPWFTRRWVVQELAFARTALVHCGTKTIAWQRLAYAVSFLQSRRLELTYMRIRDLYLGADPKTYRRGYLKTVAAETLANMSTFAVQRLLSPSTHPVFERRADLEQLLSNLSTLQCTDPLDTVYALLAVATDTSDLAIGPPDYNKSVAELYMDVVLRIIETKHSLNILCQRWAAPKDSRNSLPSWIQSYSPAATRHEGGADVSQERRRFVGDSQRSQFRAAGTRKKQGTPGRITEYEGIGRTLMVTGLIVDVIKVVGEGAYRDVPGAWKDMVFSNPTRPQSAESGAKARTSKEAFTTLSSSLQHSPRKTPAERYALFASLLTASSPKANAHVNPRNGPICEALFAPDSPYRSSSNAINVFEVRAEPTPAKLFSPTTGTPFPAADVHAFLDAVAVSTLNRALARTCNGSFALVDALIPRAEPGDVIAVLLGCDVPVVLRPKGKLDFKTTMSHGIFEFVGEAYVQGIMHGEAVEMAEKLAESGGEQQQQRVGGIFLV